MDTAEGTGVRPHGQGCTWGTLIGLGNEAPTLSGRHGRGPSLCPGQTLPLWALGGTPTRENMSQSVASTGQSLLLQALCTHPSRGGRPSPLCEGVRVPQSAATSAPSHLGGERIPESGHT